MFKICALQAEYGDCLLVTYGKTENPRYILIDGGLTGTCDHLLRHLEDLKGTCQRLRLEALVITHIDLDHINGIIKLLSPKPAWLDIEDIWFNSRNDLHTDGLGPAQGDILAGLLPKGYNKAFGGNSLRYDRRDTPVDLPDEMKVWVLSPDYQRLAALAKVWPLSEPVPPESVMAEVPPDALGKNNGWPPIYTDLIGEKFVEDTAPANGSSIALMLRYNGKMALLAGDAFPSVVADGLRHHFGSEMVKVDLLKVSHHGSAGNTSRELLEAVICNRFLISTSGKKFGHPDHVAIARAVEYAKGGIPQIIFNYRLPSMTQWESRPPGWPRYSTQYPQDGAIFVEVDLDSPEQ